MMKKNKIISIATLIFFLVLVSDNTAILLGNKIFEMVFKPLLMVVLAMVYLLSVKKAKFIYVSALFFSFWGDVLLLFDSQYFVLGLVSFLIAHLCYIKLTKDLMSKIYLKSYLKATIPFVLLLVGLIYIIKDNLGELIIPVIVYGTVISIFGTLTLLNYIENKTRNNLLLFIGSVIFIISDSFIALNEFWIASVGFDVSIITLYSISQYIICVSFINNKSINV